MSASNGTTHSLTSQIQTNNRHKSTSPDSVLRSRRTRREGSLRERGLQKTRQRQNLLNHQPSRRVLKHLSPLSGASLVRFLPAWARNEHISRYLPAAVGRKVASPPLLWLLPFQHGQGTNIPPTLLPFFSYSKKKRKSPRRIPCGAYFPP